MTDQSSEIWKLDSLPLTEKLGEYDPDFENFDQALMIDNTSGHVFLKNILDNSFLYNQEEYSYRTDNSPKTKQTLKRYTDFLDQASENKKLENIVDVGGNDLTLANILKEKADNCFVIDPVCESQDGKTINGVQVIGKRVEEVDLKALNPQVISCRHTLEHIEDPGFFIGQLFKQCPEDCIYVFEIPDFDCLVEGMRFDAVFHQHIHYFSLDTLSNLIISCGGEIISHEYNFQGSCGGALFISFKKASCKQQDIVINVDKKHTHILKNIKSFEQVMNEVANQLDTLPRPVYGYGAGLMLATYAYHLRTDLSFLETLLDDDHKKDNTGYKNLPIKISHPSNLNIPTDCSFMITSLENIRPIYNRIQNFKPRRILSPFIS